MSNHIIKFSPFVQLVLNSTTGPDWGKYISTFLEVPCERGIFYFGEEVPFNQIDDNMLSGIISEINYLPIAYKLDPTHHITMAELDLIKNSFIEKFQHMDKCLPELNELFIENSTLIHGSLFHEIAHGNIPGIDKSCTTFLFKAKEITIH